jgi:hypothetical protein
VDTSLRSTLTHPGVPFVLATTAWTMMLGFAFTAVIPIFWFTPRHLGGFGWLPCQISIFFALTGATQAVWLLIVFPRLQRRWGTNAIWRRAAFSYPVGYTSLILIALARRHGLVDAAFYPLCIVFTLAGGAMALPFTATTMAINTIAPSPAVLGALNGLALTIISLVRTFAPALYASGICRSLPSSPPLIGPQSTPLASASSCWEGTSAWSSWSSCRRHWLRCSSGCPTQRIASLDLLYPKQTHEHR